MPAIMSRGAGFACDPAPGLYRSMTCPIEPNLHSRPVGSNSSAAVPDDVWTVIGFCAIGALLSICFAASSLGGDVFSGLMAQMSWG